MHIEDFIHRLGAIDASADAPLGEQRANYDALHVAHRPADPDAMTIRNAQIDGVNVRHFIPAEAADGVVVYLHGGGWNLGSLDSHHGITANLAYRLDREVISVDYRLLPESTYVEALADCLAVVTAFEPVAVIGDSAGGRLAIDVAHRLSLKGLLGLIYPVVGTPTFDTLGKDAPLLSRADIVSLWQTAGVDVPEIPAERPPTPVIEVLAVERDPLTQPLENAVAAWRQSGASVGYRCAPNMVHAALHGHTELAEMKTAWQAFCQAVKQRLEV